MTPQTDPATLPPGPDRLLALLDAGRLARGTWTGVDEQGRRTLCALAALSDEVADAKSADACPADLMPSWLARLVPDIDDRTSAEQQPALMRRLGESARQWSRLDGAAWDRIIVVFRVACIDEAVRHVTVDKWGVRDACAEVRAALLDGDAERLERARAAADAAAGAAWVARAVAWIARSAAWVADAVACAAWAAGAAAEAAAWAAEPAAEPAAWAAGWAADAAARDAAGAANADAWDRLAAALFDAIDAEVTNAK